MRDLQPCPDPVSRAAAGYCDAALEYPNHQRPNTNDVFQPTRLRARAPFRLADAELIAAGWTARSTLRGDDGGSGGHAGGSPSLGDGGDILDLPEPLPPHGCVSMARGGSAAAGMRTGTTDVPASDGGQRDSTSSGFDYFAWAAHLDDLLQRPMADPAHALLTETGHHRADMVQGGQREAAAAPFGLGERDRRAPRRSSTWMPLFVLFSAGLVMGGVVGGAAFWLASPESRVWLEPMSRVIDQLQVTLARWL